MKAILTVLVVALGLGGCATVKRIPAQNAKLAAQGWEQAAAPVPIRGYGMNATKTLVCRQATCGGTAVYMAGGGALSSDTSFGATILAAMQSPAVNTANLRQQLITDSERQGYDRNVKIEDVQKIGSNLRVTASGTMALPNGSPGIMLMRISTAGKTLHFEATLGADRAAAQNLFRMAPLAH